MLKFLSIAPLCCLVLAAPAALAEETHSGSVDRVWEDGFRLETDARSLRVDSWDVCGDDTEKYVSVGDVITVTGEFEGREFDAFTIEDEDGNALCE